MSEGTWPGLTINPVCELDWRPGHVPLQSLIVVPRDCLYCQMRIFKTLLALAGSLRRAVDFVRRTTLHQSLSPLGPT